MIQTVEVFVSISEKGRGMGVTQKISKCRGKYYIEYAHNSVFIYVKRSQ